MKKLQCNAEDDVKDCCCQDLCCVNCEYEDCMEGCEIFETNGCEGCEYLESEYTIDETDLICPYCNQKQDVPYEIMDFDITDEAQIVECENCDREFKARVSFDPRYSTEIMEKSEVLELDKIKYNIQSL